MIGKIAFFISLCVCLSANMYADNKKSVGKPNRSANFDALPGFKNPPKGYGEVPFYWWMGDTLTKEHLTGHLEILKDKGISSLQVNYAHSDKGGKLWGLTYKSKPEIFTEEWWDLFGWFMKEANKRGMTVSLSDYTLGVGQEQYVDEALKAHPEIQGHELKFRKRKTDKEITWELPKDVLAVQAFQFSKDSTLLPSSVIDLKQYCNGGILKWSPSEGEWMVTVVYSEEKVPSYNPMHPLSGKVYNKFFFQQFEDRFPEKSKDGLNFFFSDELNFLLSNYIWDEYFRDEFKKRKGYDIVPHLVALFQEVGDKTSKYRLDYNDVMVSLCEENFFEPVYRWHEDRGLIYGCDHGGRGLDVAEFGDYFRTQRWNQGPGCDQPNLQKNIIKNKVASSIAHMYERPRVWLEGFHSSGWDTSSGALADAIFANYVQGQNLLSLHGLYYSTPGGWWEWAPPCNHFRMPYWKEMDKLLKCTERLSYILSQGYHCADVAILYPVEPVIAGNGKTAVNCAFKLGEDLYNQGIDFDFMDYESLKRATVENGKLCVSGESFKILVIPNMETIRSTSIRKAVEFQKAGGIVICADQLPKATEQGILDNELNSLVNELSVTSMSSIVSYIDNITKRDFEITEGEINQPNIMHRKIGKRNLYAVYNVDKNSKCYFRAHGAAELWDPWTGNVTPIPVCSTDEDGSYLYLPLSKTEIQLIVFDPDKKATISGEKDFPVMKKKEITGEWFTEIIPTLNNQWGDYHWPASNELLGAEIRSLEYTTHVDSNWKNTTISSTEWKKQSVSFGDKMLILEAVDHQIEESVLLSDNSTLPWKPYSFSWRWGVENDYGHQGYHGLKTEMYDDFIRLGNLKDEFTQLKRTENPNGTNYYLQTYVISPEEGLYEILYGEKAPEKVWINNKPINSNEKVRLQKGQNKVTLYYKGAGTTYFVFRNEAYKGKFVNEILKEKPLSMKWNGDLSILPYSISGKEEKQYFRFVSAPGLKSLNLSAFASNMSVWINGEKADIKEVSKREDGLASYVINTVKDEMRPALVAIELESLHHGGAVFPYPIKQTCGKGLSTLGDWSRQPGLESFSGGIKYSKEVILSKEECKKINSLDLGDVISTAEVYINGKYAGTRLTAPWTFDVKDFIKPGKNYIEVIVYNTIATHYASIPSRYKGDGKSGVVGVPGWMVE